MVLNYVILGMFFIAGAFLLLTAVFNARFMFGEDISNDPVVQSYQEKRKIPGFKRSRKTYALIGGFIIIMVIIAILNGFLEEEIKFE